MSSSKKILTSVNKLLSLYNFDIKCGKGKLKKIGRGGNAICYRLENYVIVDSIAYSEYELVNLVTISKNCVKQNINLVPIIDYAYSRRENHNTHYLIIQRFCEGKHLYSNLFYATERPLNQKEFNQLFLMHLKESEIIANLPEITYAKFILDYFRASDLGIQIDNNNSENFILRKNQIHFIDLGMRLASYPNETYLSSEIIDLLVYCDYYAVFNNKLNKEQASKINEVKKRILNKTIQTMDKLGIKHIDKKDIVKPIYILPKKPTIIIE